MNTTCNFKVVQEAARRSETRAQERKPPRKGALEEIKRYEAIEERQPFLGGWPWYRLDRGRGGILNVVPNPPSRSRQDLRDYRHDLQVVSRSFLSDFLSPRGRPYPVEYCLRRAVRWGQEGATVDIELVGEVAGFRGLFRCNSPWICPCCSYRLAVGREREIVEGIRKNAAAGGSCAMLTLTFSHSASDLLGPTLVKFRQALRHLRGHRRFREDLSFIGYSGSVRALEITWGEAHGWHPHTHDLLFFDRPVNDLQLSLLRRLIFGLWRSACLKVGLGEPSEKRGVVLSITYSPAEYLLKFGVDQKWGAGKELTRLSTKRGRQGRYSPFDLLRDGSPGHKARNELLWAEYAYATFGMRQIHWSNGLKERLGVELSPDCLVEEERGEVRKICSIPIFVWDSLLSLNLPYDVRTKLLCSVEAGGVACLRNYLLFLGQRYGLLGVECVTFY